MKAVILAGGRGERLRPITNKKPKPLCTILARPVMDYTISLLSHHGIKEAMVTTCYLSEKIRETYGNGKFGVRLSYAQEEIPLGTAGGVKLCKDFLGENESFLVISGDAVCDFDLRRAMDFHEEKDADVTIVLSSVSTPLEYGVVLYNESGRIESFSEKPDWSEALCDSVNTGVYIIKTSVLDMIPNGKQFDFSHDLFPLMLEKNMKIFGYKDSGYWCDIGKIPEYYKCNLDLLNDRFKVHTSLSGKIIENKKGKYFVSDNSFVNDSAEIGENTVISDGVNISGGAIVRGSIVMEDSSVKSGAVVKNSIICENCNIDEDAVLIDSVLGDSSEVEKNGELISKKTNSGEKISQQARFASDDEFSFTENGAEYGGNPLDIEGIRKLGKAFGKAFDDKIIVMYDRTKPESEYFASFFISGIQSAGKDSYNLGSGDEHLCSYCAERNHLPAVYITAKNKEAQIFAYEKDSLPLLRKTAVKIQKTDTDFETEHYGKQIKVSGAEDDYINAISEEMGDNNKFMLGIFGNQRAEILKKAAIKKEFSAYYEKRDNMLSIAVLGNSIDVFLGNERIFDTERARLFVIKEMLAEGRRKFVLSDTAPFIFTETIQKSGGSIEYYSSGHTAKEESKVRLAASKERWLYDNLFLSAKIIKYASRIGEKVIKNVFSAVPMFYISTLVYSPESETRLKTVGQAIPEYAGKKIRILPMTHTIKIISEASSFEAALDNAFECRGKLNEIEQKIKGR